MHRVSPQGYSFLLHLEGHADRPLTPTCKISIVVTAKIFTLVEATKKETTKEVAITTILVLHVGMIGGSIGLPTMKKQ